VLKTVATRNEGTEEVYGELERTFEHLKSEGILAERRKTVIRQHLVRLMKDDLWQQISVAWNLGEKLNEWVEEIVSGRVSPYGLLADARAQLKDRLEP
jgi:putative protein kinase ArgK-like GTPase of G3E family